MITISKVNVGAISFRAIDKKIYVCAIFMFTKIPPLRIWQNLCDPSFRPPQRCSFPRANMVL